MCNALGGSRNKGVGGFIGLYFGRIGAMVAGDLDHGKEGCRQDQQHQKNDFCDLE